MFDISDKSTFKELVGRNIRISTPSSRVGVPRTNITLLEGIVKEADFMYITLEDGRSLASDFPDMSIEFLDEFHQIKLSPMSESALMAVNFIEQLKEWTNHVNKNKS